MIPFNCNRFEESEEFSWLSLFWLFWEVVPELLDAGVSSFSDGLSISSHFVLSELNEHILFSFSTLIPEQVFALSPVHSKGNTTSEQAFVIVEQTPSE